MCVEGNFRVTFFMVIILVVWMENTALKKGQYSIHDTVNRDPIQKQEEDSILIMVTGYSYPLLMTVKSNLNLPLGLIRLGL